MIVAVSKKAAQQVYPNFIIAASFSASLALIRNSRDGFVNHTFFHFSFESEAAFLLM